MTFFKFSTTSINLSQKILQFLHKNLNQSWKSKRKHKPLWPIRPLWINTKNTKKCPKLSSFNHLNPKIQQNNPKRKNKTKSEKPNSRRLKKSKTMTLSINLHNYLFSIFPFLSSRMEKCKKTKTTKPISSSPLKTVLKLISFNSFKKCKTS